jgi:YfiH family protein
LATACRPVFLRQVHGEQVAELEAQSLDLSDPQADAAVTRERGLGCTIMVADCLPVLLAHLDLPVVAAAHAGWRGAQGGVLEATVEAMVALGAKRANIAATIGPTISQKAYEVGPEFFETFTDDDPSTKRFFAQGQGDRMLFDLPAYGLHRLSTAGVGQAQWTRHCTYSDPDRFYSYRRTTHAGEADYGRLISVIRL